MTDQAQDPIIDPVDPVEIDHIDPPADPGEPDPQPENKPKAKSAQERIDELTWQRRQAEREAAYDRQQREELAQRIAELEAKAPKPDAKTLPNGAPDPDKYAAGRYDPDYLEALTDYKVQLRFQEQEQARIAAQRKTTFAEAEAKAVEQYPDYNEAATAYAQHGISRVIDQLGLLDDAESPTDLIYYLGKNPGELDKIANMTQQQATRYMGRIEATLSAKPTETPAKPTVSTAPKPPSHLGGAKPAAVPQKDPDKMSMEEYAAWRNSQK